MFDGKGVILVRLRRFPQITEEIIKNFNSTPFEYKTNMLVNIKGAKSLAFSLLESINSDLIDPFFTTESSDKNLGFYVQNINCIGYDEFDE